MRLWLNGTTGISKKALKVLCIDPFGEPDSPEMSGSATGGLTAMDEKK